MCSRSDLCKKIGISRTHLYHLKNDKQEPTSNIWRKLEAAELAAGILPTAAPSTLPNDPAAPASPTIQAIDARVLALESQMRILTAALSSILPPNHPPPPSP